MEKEYKLEPLGEEKGKEAVAKLQQFLKDNEIEIVAGPVITRDGTLGADIQIFRRVEAIKSAFVKDGKIDGEEGK